MKKGLSILLILAACFGFYGSAVSLNDVLACKSYWEEEGEKTTADLNKLEDGLDELGENTEAYLDGIDQVAQGEKDLAKGKADLAAGEADYAAAPGKLAKGKKAIEEGEKTLKDGKNSIKKLDEAIAGCKSIKKAYKVELSPTAPNMSWKAIYAAAAGGRSTIAGGVKQLAEQLGALDPGLASVTGILAQNATNNSVEGYKTFAGAAQTALPLLKQVSTTAGNAKAQIQSEAGAILSAADASTLSAIATQAATAAGIPADNYKAAMQNKLKQSIGAYLSGSDKTAFETEVGGMFSNNTALAGVKKRISGLSDKLTAAKTGADTLAEGISSWLTAYGGALEGQKEMASGVQEIVGGILSDKETLLPAAQKAFGSQVINMVKPYASASSPLIGCTFAQFEEQMDMIDGMGLFDGIEAFFKGVKKEADKLVAAGEKDLAAGKAEYQKGLADYKAAPAKLADGRAQLEKGLKDLADGKAQLAEYEDGVQQIRDGLKTLMETEANGGLTPIAERIGVDEDFNMEDGSLNFDAAYKGVDSGREYSADSSVLITKELTQRATGFGFGIGGGVLAVLAAVLAFLKKNKVAGVLGILGAAAAGVGIFIANSAGLEFSAIAGSALGATPMVALGALAVVALIASIAFFKAPKAE